MFSRQLDRFFYKKRFVSIVSIVIFSFLVFGALVLPISIRPSTSLLNIGDVAFQDIRAPKSFSYVSQNLTEQAMMAVEITVPPVYLPADPSISRKQVEKLHNSRETSQYP